VICAVVVSLESVGDNEAVSALKAGHLEEWKRETDYHQRSLSEIGMYQYKQLLSPKLAQRDCNVQVGEALANVKAMNEVIKLGMPVSCRVE
jgi:glycine cleavage system H lipoate-binding protein